MSDIVINFLDEKGLYLEDGSFFARELGETQSPERREWIKQLSFGFAVRFLHGHLPSSVMNRLGGHIGSLTNS